MVSPATFRAARPAPALTAAIALLTLAACNLPTAPQGIRTLGRLATHEMGFPGPNPEFTIRPEGLRLAVTTLGCDVVAVQPEIAIRGDTVTVHPWAWREPCVERILSWRTITAEVDLDPGEWVVRVVTEPDNPTDSGVHISEERVTIE